MAWITSNSVSVSNGSKTVSVSGNVDLSSVDEGWGVQIGENKLVEASSGTAPNGSGVSTLTLFESWPNGSVSAATMKIIPNSGYQIALAKRIKSIADRTVDVMQLQHDYASKLGQVTATDPETNEQHVYNTLRQNQQSLDAALDNHAQSINELLANKAIDGDDTTPGALLAVGATVKQLDLTNSNVRYEPSVKPTLRADFANNKYTLYDSATNTYVDKAITDVFDITRDTPTTVTTPTGKVISVGIDKPAFEFGSGEPKGLRIRPRFTNLKTASNTLLPIDEGGVSEVTSQTSSNGSVYNKVTLSGSFAIHRTSTSSLLQNVSDAVVSVYINKDSLSDYISLNVNGTDATSNAASVKYDVNTDSVSVITGEGGLGTFIAKNAFIVRMANGDRRIGVHLSKPIGAAHQIRLQGGGLAGESFLWSEIQCEEGNIMNPLAKTTGVQVTVEPDDVERILDDEFNPDDFSFFIEGEFLSDVQLPGKSEILLALGLSNINALSLIKDQNRDCLTFRTTLNGIATENYDQANALVKDNSFRLFVNCLNGVISYAFNGVYYPAELNMLSDTSIFQKVSIGSRFSSARSANNLSVFEMYPCSLSLNDGVQLTRGDN